MTNRLHLLPSSSAAGSAAVAFPDDTTAHIHDTFTEGPVPPLETSPTLRDWLGRRLDYWSGLPSVVHQSDLDPEEIINEFCDTFARIDEFDEVVVWVADGLGESLFVCWVIAAAHAMGFDTSRWCMASPDVEAMRGRWTYLGACGPENFQNGTWTPWSDSELDAARDAWRAFTAPTPELLLDFVAELPDVEFLGSLPYLLDRYPDRNSGLDVWERRLLDRLSQHVEVTPHTIGKVLTDGWENSPDHIGDGTLFHRLLELSDPNMPRPLLRRWGTGTSMRTTYFALTKLGEVVIEGDQNRLDVLGLDRWVGGVNLDSTSGEVWCRGGSALMLESFPNAPSHAARPTLSPIAVPESYPTDQVHVVVGGGFRTLAPVVPRKRMWALPPLPAAQRGPIRDLDDWVREGIRVFADDAIDEVANVARVDEEVDEFEACLSSARQVRMWVGGAVHEWLVVGGVGCELRSLGRDPGEVLDLCEVQAPNTDRSVGDVHPLVLEHTECHHAGALILALMAVWEAFIASTPDVLNELLKTESHEPPVVRILGYLLEQFPDQVTGLTQDQAEALRRIDENHRRTFYEMAAVAETLADPGLDRPLLSRTEVGTTCLPSAFKLTEFGRRVLAGEANHVRANGLNRWAGGIHLSTEDGQVWWRHRDVIVEKLAAPRS